ncbi:MAG: hypothetical protein WD068_02145 [Candidatus Babeliales bacterium]
MEATKKMAWPYFAAFLFLSLIGATIYWWHYQNKVYPDHMIVQTIDDLSCIFHQIDATVGITGFKQAHNMIDFLTVGSFVGSEIGPMNLKYPKKWAGPYVADNPTFQGKLYQIVQAKDGYWLLPGDGVVLSNGRVVGGDLHITPDTKVRGLIESGLLVGDGMPLARKITIGQTSPICGPKKLQLFSPEIVDQVVDY